MNVSTFVPERDGVDHINVYSRGKTEAGRLLSNFAPTPFTRHGHVFASVEGFYQSMLFDDTDLRSRIANTSGNVAKQWGRKSGKRTGDQVSTWDGHDVEFRSHEFYQEIMAAVRNKLEQNDRVQEALLNTGDLPLAHYYVMWGRCKPAGGATDTFIDTLHAARAELNAERTALNTMVTSAN